MQIDLLFNILKIVFDKSGLIYSFIIIPHWFFDLAQILNYYNIRIEQKNLPDIVSLIKNGISIKINIL
jgi:hypothetical protein